MPITGTSVIQVFAESENGKSGYYATIAGSALKNWALKAITGGGTELKAGVYPPQFCRETSSKSITPPAR